MPAPQFQHLRATFNGGEQTPLLGARPDAAAYNTGCQLLENFTVRPHGGIFKRPGTEFLGYTKTDTAPIIRSFRRSTDVNFILEIGDEYMRFWYDNAGVGSQLKTTSLGTPPTFAAWASATSYAIGDYVYRSGATYQCINAHNSANLFTQPGTGTSWQFYWEQFFYSAGEAYSISGSAYTVKETHSPDGLSIDLTKFYELTYDGVSAYIYEISTPWAVEDAMDLQLCQLNDVVFFTHPDYEPRRLTRVSNEEWALEKVPFEFAPVLDPDENNVTLKLVYAAPEWVASTAYTANVSFVTYAQEFYICKTSNTDGAFTPSNWNKAIYKSGWNTGQAYVLGNVVEESGQNYICISAHSAGTFATDLAFPRWVRIPYTDYKLYGAFNTFTADDVDTVWLLKPGTTDRVVREPITGSGTKTTATVFIQGSFIARTEWNSNTGPANTTIRLLESLDRNNWTVVREWVNNLITGATITYESEAPQKGAWYRMESTAVAGVVATSYMIIEPISAQVSIPFRITSYNSGSEVIGVAQLAADKSIPNEALGTAFPIWQKGAFSEVQGWPRCVTFHDGRLWFASTRTQPARLWASQLDDFYTFQTGADDTAGLDVTLASTQANDIQWIASFNRQLVIGTTGEEWTLDSGDNDEVLTPSKIRARRRTRYGSAPMQPQLTGNSLLWLSRNALSVYEFAYQFESDSFVANDMTLLAEHITAGGVMQMAFQAADDQVLYCVLPSGAVVCFTYQREQQVAAWARYPTFGGSFVSVATIYGRQDLGYSADQVWFVTTRFGNVCMERFNPAMAQKQSIYETGDSGTGDFCFVDSAIQAPSTGTSFTGFQHLANRQVQAWIDGTIKTIVANVDESGDVEFSQEVPEGTWIGEPITSRARPQPFEMPLQDGSGHDRRWRAGRISLNAYGASEGFIFLRPDQSDNAAIQWEDTASGVVTGTYETNTNFDWRAERLAPTLDHYSAGPFGILGMVIKAEVDSK